MTVTQREVNSSVRRYFKANGISLQHAGELLGMNKKSVGNQINSRVFSEKIADKRARAFGFNAHYLLTGKGKLVKRQTSYHRIVQQNDMLNSIIASQRHTIEKLKAEIARLNEENLKLEQKCTERTKC